MLKRVTQVAEYELPIKMEPQKEGGFVVRCPAWSDCFAQGETIDEALLEITAVAQSLIELYKEENMRIPLKRSKQKRTVAQPLSLPIFVSA